MNPDKIDRHSNREVLKAFHHLPGLEPRIRYLASIEALVALGKDHTLHNLFDLALDEGVALDEIHEILLQACIFCGLPKTANGFSVLRRCLGERGIEQEGDGFTSLDARTPDEMNRMGLDLFNTIYRYNHQDVLRSLKESHPELPRWVIGDIYGKVLSRPILDPKTRELAAVAALCVSRVFPQLLSHIKGGLNLGADIREVREVILQMEAYAPEETVRRAIRILNLGTRPMRRLHHSPATKTS